MAVMASRGGWYGVVAGTNRRIVGCRLGPVGEDRISSGPGEASIHPSIHPSIHGRVQGGDGARLLTNSTSKAAAVHSDSSSSDIEYAQRPIVDCVCVCVCVRVCVGGRGTEMARAALDSRDGRGCSLSGSSFNPVEVMTCREWNWSRNTAATQSVLGPDSGGVGRDGGPGGGSGGGGWIRIARGTSFAEIPGVPDVAQQRCLCLLSWWTVLRSLSALPQHQQAHVNSTVQCCPFPAASRRLQGSVSLCARQDRGQGFQAG